MSGAAVAEKGQEKDFSNSGSLAGPWRKDRIRIYEKGSQGPLSLGKYEMDLTLSCFQVW